MSSGARCEEALPGTALGGIAMSILTSYYGNGGAKFSKKIGSNRPSYGFVALRRPTTPFGSLQRQPNYFKKRFMPSRSMMA